MIKQGIAALLAVPFLCSPLAFAQSAMEFESKDPGARPQHFCAERYARKAAHLAYLEAKLNLTDQQKPAWTKWHQAKMDAAEKQRAACLQRDRSGDEHETALDREAQIEKRLTTRLQELQASHPALQAIYEALTPEQRVLFDQASRWHGWHGHRHARWFGNRGDGDGQRGHWHDREGDRQPGQD